jgi:hypothetical protein
MTRPTLAEAADQHDITLALTPSQLLLIAIGALILVRILRGLRR